jgi:F-type H+-transporting ATPase subunit b
MNNPLVQPDPGLYIWTIATFLILLGLLARFAWRPLLDALEQRQEVIRKSLDDARQARQELEQVKTEAAKLLSDARVEAGEIVSRTRSDAARFADEMKVKARADGEALVKQAERQIDMQTKRAVESIRLEAVDLSVAIASKILQRDISKEDNERLIQDTLKEMQSRIPKN